MVCRQRHQCQPLAGSDAVKTHRRVAVRRKAQVLTAALSDKLSSSRPLGATRLDSVRQVECRFVHHQCARLHRAHSCDHRPINLTVLA
jgi:hypothetical protein